MRITEPEIHICAYPGVDADRDHCFRDIQKEFGPTTQLIERSADGSIYHVALAGGRQPTADVAAELGALDSVAAAWVRPELQLTGLPATDIGDPPELALAAPAGQDGRSTSSASSTSCRRSRVASAPSTPGSSAAASARASGSSTSSASGGSRTRTSAARRPRSSWTGRRAGTSTTATTARACSASSPRSATRSERAGCARRRRSRAVSIEGDGRTVAGSILKAAEKLRPGDILLLEMMAPGPRAKDLDSQAGWVPIERWPAELAAIQTRRAPRRDRRGGGRQRRRGPELDGLRRAPGRLRPGLAQPVPRSRRGLRGDPGRRRLTAQRHPQQAVRAGRLAAVVLQLRRAGRHAGVGPGGHDDRRPRHDLRRAVPGRRRGPLVHGPLQRHLERGRDRGRRARLRPGHPAGRGPSAAHPAARAGAAARVRLGAAGHARVPGVAADRAADGPQGADRPRPAQRAPALPAAPRAHPDRPHAQRRRRRALPRPGGAQGRAPGRSRAAAGQGPGADRPRR